MHYYLDTEFIEDGSTIDLISIGIVAEDGREYYAINYNCDFSKADYWVLENVLKPIGLDQKGFYYNLGNPDTSPAYRESYSHAKTKDTIAHEVAMFMGCAAKTEELTTTYSIPEYSEKPEVWGYYSAYDWVAFAQLFGTMMNLPKRFPMYCRDIKQLCDSLGNPDLPEQGKGEHNALSDARWNKAAYEYLMEIQNAA